MVNPKSTTRQRIVQSALELFVLQGITETTTRQIADQAEVNEVTLFRHFGSKQGLLLAVIQEADALAQMGIRLGEQGEQVQNFDQAVQIYAEIYLEAVDPMREFMRSLVGEAGQYPPETRQAIADCLHQGQHLTEQYLATVTARVGNPSTLSVSTLASLLNTLLLGYLGLNLTTEFHPLWPSRQGFIQTVTDLLQGQGLPSAGQASATVTAAGTSTETTSLVEDLPGPLVRAILQAARKAGPQDYAIAYVLFGAGLSPQELVSLQRIHSLADSQQHLLQIPPRARQVPLNQWIMGYRYGSYVKNPLTQWLKARKDSASALFINEAGEPLKEMELRLRWQALTAEIVTPTGQPPAITQPQQTWCVEMLMRGMDPQALGLITGWSPAQLAPYQRQAQARLAVEQALRLDQKPAKGDRD